MSSGLAVLRFALRQGEWRLIDDFLPIHISHILKPTNTTCHPSPRPGERWRSQEAPRTAHRSFNRRSRHYHACCSFHSPPAGRFALRASVHRTHASLRCCSERRQIPLRFFGAKRSTPLPRQVTESNPPYTACPVNVCSRPEKIAIKGDLTRASVSHGFSLPFSRKKKEGSLFYSLQTEGMYIFLLYCTKMIFLYAYNDILPLPAISGGSLLFVSAKSRQKPCDTLSLAKSLYSPFPGRRSQSASLCSFLASRCLLGWAVLPSSVPETGRGILRRSLLSQCGERLGCTPFHLARGAIEANGFRRITVGLCRQSPSP